MERNLFKDLLGKFEVEKDFNKKVDLLLTYDLKKLTNGQIQRILNVLEENETGKLIKAIDTKIGEK